MKLQTVLETMIDPALAKLPTRWDTPAARVMMLATGLQESRFTHRVQMGNGPARSFWQFERGTEKSRGGVTGIYLHDTSRGYLKAACIEHGVKFEPRAIWEAITNNDVLAATCARLLLATDAAPLPAIGDVEGAWRCYALRTWRPGKPHRATWDAFYNDAVAAVGA